MKAKKFTALTATRIMTCVGVADNEGLNTGRRRTSVKMLTTCM
jgi:hypothetical protein